MLESSFVAEVKSDLMGEQTIFCGMLQAGSLLSFDKMTSQGIDAGWAAPSLSRLTRLSGPSGPEARRCRVRGG